MTGETACLHSAEQAQRTFFLCPFHPFEELSVTQPCMNCARAGTSCCKGYQILLTTGDLERISGFLGDHDFFTFETPVPEEFSPDYDPTWLPMILGSDTQVRVLKRTPEKNCSLLTPTGCRLPFDRRPLICRLYPYTYTEQGILGVDAACPISREKEWGTVLEHLDMPTARATQWLTQLYAEVRGSVPGSGRPGLNPGRRPRH